VTRFSNAPRCEALANQKARSRLQHFEGQNWLVLVTSSPKTENYGISSRNTRPAILHAWIRSEIVAAWFLTSSQPALEHWPTSLIAELRTVTNRSHRGAISNSVNLLSGCSCKNFQRAPGVMHTAVSARTLTNTQVRKSQGAAFEADSGYSDVHVEPCTIVMIGIFCSLDRLAKCCRQRAASPCLARGWVVFT
jgi:hypothetical protein